MSCKGVKGRTERARSWVVPTNGGWLRYVSVGGSPTAVVTIIMLREFAMLASFWLPMCVTTT